MHIFVISIGITIIILLETLKIKKSTKLIIVASMLLLFGIFALYSISIYESFDQTLKRISQNRWVGEPSNYYFFSQQVKNIFKALVIVALVYTLPIKRLKNDRNIIFIGIGALLIQLLVFTPLWVDLNGARWRIVIPWLWNLQPSEFFKVWLVIFLSWWMIRKHNMLNSKEFYIALCIILWIIFVIFLFIPDLGSIFVMGIVTLIMCRYKWAKLKYLLTICTIWGLIGLMTITIFPQKFWYITERLSFFVNEKTEENQKSIGRQTQQALIGIGWWWFWWQWYGKWLQKFGQIPEAQSDFIFAALSEEIGFVGNMFIILLYFLIAYYTLTKLYTIKDQYSKLIAVWLLSLIMVQTFVNIGVNTSILPNTGLTLPFMSYWGTALMVNLIEIIIIYKILENK